MYDLQAHDAVIVHVADITPYEYQPDVGRLLILPPDEKRLLDILRQGIRMKDKDVIGGKTGGCLIIIQGEPGVGKTLSAQVFAEQNKRSLYEIQCAQLGIQPDEVEKNLRTALLRARRWNAVLLINEADVFVHTRGTDIVQNAIVGVFLRLLESLDSACFLTTNKGTIIDDAIYSRAIVHLKYGYPDKDGRNAIFTDQAKLQGLQLPTDVARALANKHDLSGRDIRQLIKLAKLLHLSEGKDITLQDMEWALRWRQSRKADPPVSTEQAG
jgi:AAA+ superfamily predicted ATPase